MMKMCKLNDLSNKIDEECIKSLIVVTKKSKQTLSQSLEIGRNEAANICKPFKNYREITTNLKNNMHKIEEKNYRMKTINENYQKLYAILSKLIKQLDFTEEDEETLSKIDLTKSVNRNRTLKIASVFCQNKNLIDNLDPGLLKLKSIQGQLRKLEKIRYKFSDRIYCLFGNILILSMNLNNDNSDHELKELSLIILMPPKHLLTLSLSSSSSSSSNLSAISVANLQYFKGLIDNTHKNLLEFAQLMHWLQIVDESTFDSFKNKYIEILSKLYEKYLHSIFDNEIAKVSKKYSKGGASGDFLETSTSTTSTLLRSTISASDLNSSNAEINIDNTVSLLGNESEWPTKIEMDEHILENCLNEIEHIFEDEEQFCKSFFFNGNNNESVTKLKKSLVKIFASFELELKSFNNFLEAVNGGCFCMNILIDLNNFITKISGNAPQLHYLNEVLASNLIQAKRSLDKFMTLQINSVRDAKLPKRSPCGLLNYVRNLEKLAIAAQPLLNSNRRTDLEKWYSRLINKILECIVLHSEQHYKTPAEVIKMENFHHLYSTLSQMKINCLDAQRKEAKQRYNEALNAYVSQYFGRPLEKLNVFFDGVQSRIANGVKESEIGYHSAYSKHELRKVIQQYPQKEVKRGLEHLYKKIDKHLSDEVNLIPVVWRAMEQEFILQYKMIDEMIHKCYPGAMITLDFTIDDILKVFSKIN